MNEQEIRAYLSHLAIDLNVGCFHTECRPCRVALPLSRRAQEGSAEDSVRTGRADLIAPQQRRFKNLTLKSRTWHLFLFGCFRNQRPSRSVIISAPRPL